MTKPNRVSLTQRGSAKPTPDDLERTAAKTRTLEQVSADYELRSVQCLVESQANERLNSDEDLLDRITAVVKEGSDARTSIRLGWMTCGYRVDQNITPRLFELGRLLTRVLRLPHPLDLFVSP